MCFTTPIILAPMAGYTDLSFRLQARALGGLGLAHTEMLSPRSFLVGKAKKVAQLLATTPDDKPLSYQIYGHEPAAVPSERSPSAVPGQGSLTLLVML